MFNIIKTNLLEKALVIENDYLNKYIQLICDNKNTIKTKFVTHCHHIIPRYYYRVNNLPIDNSKSNLVNLKYSDHILAHYYLAMCSSTKRFKDSNLCGIRRIIRGFDPESDEVKLFEMLPEIQSYYEEVKHVNCLHEDTPQKISASIKGRISIQNSDGHQKYVYEHELESYINSGWIIAHNLHNDISKSKISMANHGRKHINKDGLVKSIKLEDLDTYLNNGWSLGEDRSRESAIKGKISIIKDGINKFINPEELETFIQEGWIRGNINKGKSYNISGRRKFTQEQKEQASKILKGKRAIHKDNICKYVVSTELITYLADGWILGTGNTGGIGTKGKVWITNGIEDKYIYIEDLDSIPNEWYRGRSKNKKIKS